MFNTRSLAFAAVASLLVFSAGCAKLKSRDEINQGVASFKGAKYAAAVEHFKTAVDLDPENQNGRVYLATSYMQQYVPGVDSPENTQMAKMAREEFTKVLDKSPNDKLALAYLASLSYLQANGVPDLDAKLKRLDEAREWYLKLIAVDPQNKEAFYTLGVISWAKSYPARMAARVKCGMKPEDPGPIKDKKLRAELREKNGPVVEDGIKNLQKAIEIDPNYDDAMSYINLVFRERADIAETAEDSKKDSDQADTWVQKSLDTKKMKAAKAAQAPGGIVQDK